MIFDRLGQFATRFRVPIIIVWIATAVVITLTAPNIEKVASSDQADFLPSDAPYIHAEEVLKETFPEGFAPGNTVIVIQAPDGVLDQSGADFAAQTDSEVGRFFSDLADWLIGPDAPPHIQDVMTPVSSPAAAALMVSDDNRVALARVDLLVTGSDERTLDVLTEIDEWLDEHAPAGAQIYQTGAGPIVSDTTSSVKTSVDRTIWVTVVLVIIMLLVVYRSPVSPLIPLSAVTVAYLIARGIVAFLGAHVMTISSYANVMLVVVMYGAGTDYCLFLISRFREEMAERGEIEPATERTVHMVGETITSSAGTIFVGFMAMSLAKMGIFNTTGPSLAIGIVLSLAAGLTFVPALLSALGDRAFWPGKATHRAHGRLYELTSKAVSTYPLMVIVIIVAIMAPLSLYGVNQSVTYDLLADLPEDKPAVVGYAVMQDSLGAGNVMPLTVVVTGRDPDYIAQDIAQLTNELAAINGVDDVRGLNTPLGFENPEYGGLLRVDNQLRMALSFFGGMEAGQLPELDQIEPMLAGVQSYLDLLATRFPTVAEDEHMLALREMLEGSPLQLLTRQDDLAAALDGLATRFESIDDAYLMPTAFSDLLAAMPATGGDLNGDLFSQLLPTYVAQENTAFKLDVILTERSSTDLSMSALTEIRATLRGYRDQGDAVVSGGSAINTDVRDTMDDDLLRAISFVLIGIFVVLLLMLRSAIAPLYLIGTVLLSFTFTLGLTNVVFKTFLDVPGLTWYVPFFIFVFLVALGIDYSIFLFGRVKEEVGYHGIREGVHVAVASTGAIITSAGIILAGTFAAMTSGEVMGLRELGFAVAVGVLIDTFVVRTVLDPALATFFGRWTWWPGGVPQTPAAQDAPGEPIVDVGD